MSTKDIVSALGNETSAALKRVIEPYNGDREVTLAFGLWLLQFAVNMLSLWLPKDVVAAKLRETADEVTKGC